MTETGFNKLLGAVATVVETPDIGVQVSAHSKSGELPGSRTHMVTHMGFWRVRPTAISPQTTQVNNCLRVQNGLAPDHIHTLKHDVIPAILSSIKVIDRDTKVMEPRFKMDEVLELVDHFEKKTPAFKPMEKALEAMLDSVFEPILGEGDSVGLGLIWQSLFENSFLYLDEVFDSKKEAFIAPGDLNNHKVSFGTIVLYYSEKDKGVRHFTKEEISKLDPEYQDLIFSIS